MKAKASFNWSSWKQSSGNVTPPQRFLARASWVWAHNDKLLALRTARRSGCLPTSFQVHPRDFLGILGSAQRTLKRSYFSPRSYSVETGVKAKETPGGRLGAGGWNSGPAALIAGHYPWWLLLW